MCVDGVIVVLAIHSMAYSIDFVYNFVKAKLIIIIRAAQLKEMLSK